MAGGDNGPSLAGGSSTAALEFESCLLQHLYNYCASWIWKEFSDTAAAAVALYPYSYCSVSTTLSSSVFLTFTAF